MFLALCAVYDGELLDNVNFKKPALTRNNGLVKSLPTGEFVYFWQQIERDHIEQNSGG